MGVLMSERDKDRLRSAFPEYVERVEDAEKNILRAMLRKIVALNEKDTTRNFEAQAKGSPAHMRVAAELRGE